MELLVVLAVVVMLTSLMMPLLSHVKENAHRIVCGSNQRQIGVALFAWGADNNDFLPDSHILLDIDEQLRIQDLMSSHRGQRNELWDGLGRLWEQKYIDSPACFYCPSHKGDHHFDNYAEDWYDRIPPNEPRGRAEGKIFMNYHYCGHVDWEDRRMRRRLTEGHEMVLVTDGLRTQRDFNHVDGMNRLRGDGSVKWVTNGDDIRPQLPRDTGDYVMAYDGRSFTSLWKQIEAGE